MKQEKVKDYPWVETRVNLAIGPLNVTYDRCNGCRGSFQQKESHCPLWHVNFSLPDIKQLKHILYWKLTGGSSKVQPRNSLKTYIIYNGMNSKLELERLVNFEMSFQYLQYFRKEQKIQPQYYGISSQNCFRLFFGRIGDTQKTFWN